MPVRFHWSRHTRTNNPCSSPTTPTSHPLVHPKSRKRYQWTIDGACDTLATITDPLTPLHFMLAHVESWGCSWRYNWRYRYRYSNGYGYGYKRAAAETRLSSQWICKIRDKHLQFGQSRHRYRFTFLLLIVSALFLLFMLRSDIYNSIVLISFRTLLIFHPQSELQKEKREGKTEVQSNWQPVKIKCLTTFSTSLCASVCVCLSVCLCSLLFYVSCLNWFIYAPGSHSFFALTSRTRICRIFIVWLTTFCGCLARL